MSIAKTIPVPNEIRETHTLVIIEMPTQADLVFGKFLTGQEGRLFNAMFEQASEGLPIEKRLYVITGMVRHRPYDIMLLKDKLVKVGREPNAKEIIDGIPDVMSMYHKVKPKVIFLIGKTTERFYFKEFPDAYQLQPMNFLVKQGGANSPWYKTNLRMIEEALHDS